MHSLAHRPSCCSLGPRCQRLDGTNRRQPYLISNNYGRESGAKTGEGP